MVLVDPLSLQVTRMIGKQLMGGEGGGTLDTPEGEAFIFRVQCDGDCRLRQLRCWVFRRCSVALLSRGVYSSLFPYIHIYKKLPLLADCIKNRPIL